MPSKTQPKASTKAGSKSADPSRVHKEQSPVDDDPQVLSEARCHGALAVVKLTGRDGVALWVEVCDWAFFLLDFATLSTAQQAATARVTFPEFTPKIKLDGPPDSPSSPKSAGADSPSSHKKAGHAKPIPKLDVTLAPGDFFMVDNDVGFTIVACSDDQTSAIKKHRKPIPLAAVAARATWPAPDEPNLITMRWLSAYDPLEQYWLALTAAPSNRELKAAFDTSFRAPSGKGIGGVPVFEVLPSDVGESSDEEKQEAIPRHMKLVGFVRTATGHECRAAPAVTVARSIEAHVAMKLFKQVVEDENSKRNSVRTSSKGSIKSSRLAKTTSLSQVSRSSGAIESPDIGMRKARECMALRRCAAHEDGEGRNILVSLGCADKVCEAMKAHPEVAALQEQGCAVVRNLAVGGAACEDILHGAGAHVVVVEAMKGHPDSGAVQEQGCAALGNIACAEWGKSAVVKAGGLNCVLAAMEKHPSDLGVQLQGIGALWNLGVNSLGNRELIAKGGGLKSITRAMSLYKIHATLQANACAAIGNIVASCPVAKGIAATVDVGKYVCDAMGAHHQDPVVQRHGCAAIWALTAMNPKNQQVLGLGGVRHIAAAMRHHSGNPQVLEYACGAVRTLAAHNADLKQSFFEVGGLQLIYAAIAAFGDNAPLQKQAFGALWNLSAGSSAEVNEKMSAKDGMILLFAGIKRHQADATILEGICGALRNLIADGIPEVRTKFLKGGLVENLWLAMTDHLENAILLRQIYEMLVHACQGGEGDCHMVAKEDLLALMIRGMHEHLSDTLLQERGCHVFRWLADARSGTRAVVVRAGAVKAVSAALQTHKTSVPVQLRGLSALLHLAGLAVDDDEAPAARDQDFVTEVAGAGATGLALEALQNLVDSAPVMEVACRLLRRVSTSKAHVESAVKQGLVEKVAAAMRRHLGTKAIQRQACLLLAIVGSVNSKAMHQLAGDEGAVVGIEDVATAMREYTDEPGVQMGGLQCFLALLTSSSQVAEDSATKHGSLEVACAALKAHEQDEPLNRVGGDVLCRSLARGRDMLDKAVDLGALDLLRSSLDFHVGSVPFVMSALEALRLLEGRVAPLRIQGVPPPAVAAAKEEMSAQAKGALITIHRICKAMRTNGGSLEIHRKVCALLQELFAEYPEAMMEPEPPPAAFNKNDYVLVKDHPEQEAKRGIVTKVKDDIFVKVEQWLESYPWKIIEKSRRKSVEENEFDKIKLKQQEKEILEKARREEAEKVEYEKAERTRTKHDVNCKKVAQLLCSSMDTFDDVGLQQHACRALFQMTRGNLGGKMSALYAGALKEITRVLHHEPKKGAGPVVHRYALAVLWNLTANRKEGKDEAADARAVGLVCDVMKNHEIDMQLQLNGCGAIGCCVKNHLQNQNHAVEHEAAKLIVAAMTKYPANELMQQVGAMALAGIAADSRLGQKSIIDAKGIPALCAAFERFNRMHHTVSLIYEALWRVTIDDIFSKGMVLNSLGANTIVLTMDRHQKDPQLQRHACELLQSLCFGDKNNLDAIAQAEDIVEFTLLAMKQHPEDLDVQRHCLALLGNITFKSLHVKHQVNYAGGIPVILKSMDNHRMDPVINETACWALGNIIAGSIKNQHTLVKSGGIKQLKKVMAKFDGEWELLKQATAVLRRCEDCEDKRSESDDGGFGGAGGAVPVDARTHSSKSGVRSFFSRGSFLPKKSRMSSMRMSSFRISSPFHDVDFDWDEERGCCARIFCCFRRRQPGSRQPAVDDEI